jgi:hypothetical protein
LQPSHPTPLVPLAQRLDLVRCPGCHAEWHDMDAATHQDGYSEKGCPNGCGLLTDQVYVLDLDGPRERWVRTEP